MMKLVGTLRTAALALAAFSMPMSTDAQVLIGTVLQDGRDLPVAGAAVSLVDRDGDTRAQVLADSLGRFRIVPPAAGEYYVRAERIGLVTTSSPLLALSDEGTATFEILMPALPIGLEGFEVSVEREAELMLQQYGLTPAALGNRWIDRDDMDAMPVPPDPRQVIRWRNIPGLWFSEDRPGQRSQGLCLTFLRTVGCALLILNGAIITPEAALSIQPEELEAIALLPPTEAATHFGTQAGSGVLLMWTRAGRR